MKKLTVVPALMIVSIAAFSQVQMAIGIKAGPNFAKINTEEGPGQNYKNRAGFHGGAFALFKFSKIGIQPEILFSQQGTTVEFNSQNLEQNYSYINVPIMLKLYTVAGINLQVGPQFGFASKAEIETLVNGNKTTADVKDKLKGSDFGLAIGAGWDLPFGLTIDARYNLGLSKLYDEIPPTVQSTDAKNQVIQVSVGFKLIKLGK
jgi:hypothetical protein